MTQELKLDTKNFSVRVTESTLHGWFEHNELGDNCGGELLFEVENDVITLVDYDGVFELPSEVIRALHGHGINVEYVLDEDN
jgi:hypothetical protein